MTETDTPRPGAWAEGPVSATARLVLNLYDAPVAENTWGYRFQPQRVLVFAAWSSQTRGWGLDGVALNGPRILKDGTLGKQDVEHDWYHLGGKPDPLGEIAETCPWLVDIVSGALTMIIDDTAQAPSQNTTVMSMGGAAAVQTRNIGGIGGLAGGGGGGVYGGGGVAGGFNG